MSRLVLPRQVVELMASTGRHPAAVAALAAQVGETVVVDIPARAVDRPGGVGAVEPVSCEPPGPGTVLRAILAGLGLSAGGGCQCAARAAQMDKEGPSWCLDNLDIIVGWLREGRAIAVAAAQAAGQEPPRVPVAKAARICARHPVVSLRAAWELSRRPRCWREVGMRALIRVAVARSRSRCS